MVPVAETAPVSCMHTLFFLLCWDHILWSPTPFREEEKKREEEKEEGEEGRRRRRKEKKKRKKRRRRRMRREPSLLLLFVCFLVACLSWVESAERMTMYVEYPILTTVKSYPAGYDAIDCPLGGVTSKLPRYAIPLYDCQNKVNITWSNPIFNNRVCSEVIMVNLYQREMGGCTVNGAVVLVEGDGYDAAIDFPLEVSDCGYLTLYGGDPSASVEINAVSCPVYSPDELSFDLF